MPPRSGRRTYSHVPRSTSSGPDQSQSTVSKQRQGGRTGPPTHFLCIPLVTPISRPPLEESLRAFRDDVLAQGVSDAAVRPVGSVHLTIGVMCLPTHEALQNACQLLESSDVAGLLDSINDEQTPVTTHDEKAQAPQTQRTDTGSSQPHSLRATVSPPELTRQTHTDPRPGKLPKPLEVSLRSLHSMRDPRATSILYARPEDSSSRLLPFCESLRTIFTEAGVLREENRPLKLHATVFNGQHARVRVPGKVGKAPLTIDATSLLEKWSDAIWTPSFELEKVAICKMRAEDVYDTSGAVVDKEYKEVCSVALPTCSREPGSSQHLSR